MAFTPNNKPIYYTIPVSYKNQFGSTAVTTIPVHSALSGKTNVSTDISLLVPVNTNQPIELFTIYAYPRGTITPGTLMLLVDDGTTVHLVDQITYSAQSISTVASNSRIQFTNFNVSTPLVIQPGETVYLVSTVAQSVSFDGVAIGGIY